MTVAVAWLLGLVVLVLLGALSVARHQRACLRREIGRLSRLLDQFHQDYQARELRRGK